MNPFVKLKLFVEKLISKKTKRHIVHLNDALDMYRHPFMMYKDDNDEQYIFLVDTGANLNMIQNKTVEYIKKNGGEIMINKNKMRYAGVGGEQEGTLCKIKFEPFGFDEDIFIMCDDFNAQLEYRGILGYPYLRKHNMVVDYQKNILIFD